MAQSLLSVMKVPELKELLAYKNEQVVRYYCHKHPETAYSQAVQLFEDYLAWTWLSAYRKTFNRPTYLFGALLPIDEMWHAFILHTQAYHAFCQHFFDEYFHHHVEPPGEEHELNPDELENFLQDCFEFLGDEWVLRYFSDSLSLP